MNIAFLSAGTVTAVTHYSDLLIPRHRLAQVLLQIFLAAGLTERIAHYNYRGDSDLSRSNNLQANMWLR